MLTRERKEFEKAKKEFDKVRQIVKKLYIENMYDEFDILNTAMISVQVEFDNLNCYK